MSRMPRTLSVLIVLSLLLASMSYGTETMSAVPRDPQIGTQTPPDPLEKQAEKQRDREMQRQRYIDLKKRAERLLEVATELKQYVDRAGDNVMSLEVLKKAQEMEKLSKDLQKRMKGE